MGDVIAKRMSGPHIMENSQAFMSYAAHAQLLSKFTMSIFNTTRLACYSNLSEWEHRDICRPPKRHRHRDCLIRYLPVEQEDYRRDVVSLWKAGKAGRARAICKCSITQ
ncbi:predicted protein [Histoplasma capsulatum var. duboisii H88]|uniref:Predicted protein n=1 Tax=Ajellomyces capsulatus (strain H88) TaxID=544711 RepID=F0UD39_AJEC8|nr:predicted protein [Histoplasma capsulatum var. duboisii H88]